MGASISSILPVDLYEAVPPTSLGADVFKRSSQPVGVMHTLPVTGNLGTDCARGVGLIPGAINLSNGALIDALDLKCANAGAIMGAGGVDAHG